MATVTKVMERLLTEHTYWQERSDNAQKVLTDALKHRDKLDEDVARVEWTLKDAQKN